MKTINISLQLTFDEKITSDEDIQEVVSNTMSAIIDRADNGFISPVENENVSLIEVNLKERFTKFELTERV